jgi:protein required for attachment to host cells
MTETCVVVADSYRARFFDVESVNGPLLEVKTLLQPDARLSERELVSDTPGRAKEGSDRRQTMEPRTGAKTQNSIEFARLVAHELGQALNEGRYTQLIIVAAPSFLGELRKHLDKQTRNAVVLEMGKDLSQMTSDVIREHLPKRLPRHDI